jgi:hypothetical protein
MNTDGRQLFTRGPFFDASFKYKVLYFWQLTIGTGIAPKIIYTKNVNGNIFQPPQDIQEGRRCQKN